MQLLLLKFYLVVVGYLYRVPSTEFSRFHFRSIIKNIGSGLGVRIAGIGRQCILILARNSNFEVSRAFSKHNISTELRESNQNKSLKEQEYNNIRNYALSKLFMRLNLRTNFFSFMFQCGIFRTNNLNNKGKVIEPKHTTDPIRTKLFK